jgi:hypothetical protein
VLSTHGHSHSHSHEEQGHSHDHEHDHEPAKVGSTPAKQEIVLTMDEAGEPEHTIAIVAKTSQHAECSENGHDGSGHSHDHQECSHSHECSEGHTHAENSHSHSHSHSHDGEVCMGHSHEHQAKVPASSSSSSSSSSKQPVTAQTPREGSTTNAPQKLSSFGMSVQMGKWLVQDGGKLSTIACFVLIILTKLVKVGALFSVFLIDGSKD